MSYLKIKESFKYSTLKSIILQYVTFVDIPLYSM